MTLWFCKLKTSSSPENVGHPWFKTFPSREIKWAIDGRMLGILSFFFFFYMKMFKYICVCWKARKLKRGPSHKQVWAPGVPGWASCRRTLTRRYLQNTFWWSQGHLCSNPWACVKCYSSAALQHCLVDPQSGWSEPLLLSLPQTQTNATLAQNAEARGIAWITSVGRYRGFCYCFL